MFFALSRSQFIFSPWNCFTLAITFLRSHSHQQSVACPCFHSGCGWSPPEDEQQQKTLSGNKTVKQLTMERDQAMADLNSVERSLSDLFRRYENMKTILEGFKKVSLRLSWAVES